MEQDTTPPQQNVQNNSNDFGFVVPTEFVELPSKGVFYTQGHPLHNQDTIEIKHMTAKEEDILTNLKTFYSFISKNKPDAVKGAFIKKVSIASTMGVGLKINHASLR